MIEILEKAAMGNGLVAAFALVGLIVLVSGQISRHLTFGRVHGSAIAIVIGLGLAYLGGKMSGGHRGLADLSLFGGIGLMGGAMLRDFAIVATAFEVQATEARKAGLIGAVSLLLGTVLPFIVGACVARAFGYSDAVSMTTIGAGAVTYIVGPVTGAAIGASPDVMALSIATGLVKAYRRDGRHAHRRSLPGAQDAAVRDGLRRPGRHGERRVRRAGRHRPQAGALRRTGRHLPHRVGLPAGPFPPLLRHQGAGGLSETMDRLNWNTKALNRADRLARARHALGTRLDGKLVATDAIVPLLEATLEAGDRVCLEGNNQKQADFLARSLRDVDPQQVHDLHMVQSVLALPEHLDLFENGVARRLDFSFSGPQGARLANLVSARRIEIGAIHTYLELFARYFVDLTPKVALVAAHAADAQGNLYTGPNTEDTPAIVEATAFSGGIVIAQVNELVDGATTKLPRVDIPADWVDFVVKAPRPNFIEPLFTRDPAQISEIQVLMAMMAIKGIYAEYGVQRLNHGIGFDTAAIELLLPTYAESLGLKGRICRHWALNPHPALIPAIEAGWVESIHSFGSELGMEEYIRARGDVFFTGADGSLRSNRAFCQAAGHYACDLFIGSTLQIDLDGNSSTATLGRITGFGGAPNMGADARGRRHASPRVAEGGPRGPRRPHRRGRHPARPEAGGPDGGDLPRTHAAGVRRAARRLDAAGAGRHGAAADHDLRRRRDAHPDRGRHRQPSAGAQRRGARAGDPRRGRLYAGGAGARPPHGGEPARPRRHPPARGPGGRPADGHPQPAGRPLDARPLRRLGRPVPPAGALSQLVGHTP
jgi:malonate decarboxylase alpha subunit